MLDYDLDFRKWHRNRRLLNTLCRTEFPSPTIKPETVWKGCTCTQLMQVGYKPKSGICVMDKPGWDDDDMIMFHLQQYKCIFLWGRNSHCRHLGSFSISAAPSMPNKNMCCKDASHCADKKPFSVQILFCLSARPTTRALPSLSVQFFSVVRRALAISIAILHFFCRRMVCALRFHQ